MDNSFSKNSQVQQFVVHFRTQYLCSNASCNVELFSKNNSQVAGSDHSDVLTYSFRPLGGRSPLRILLGELLLGPLGGQAQSVDGQHAGGAGGGGGGGGLHPGEETAGYGGEEDPHSGSGGHCVAGCGGWMILLSHGNTVLVSALAG